ncbi:MAG: 3-methyladenine DNA glycosylase [Chloracidobacterium sp. CP2_5A]|nr:MAG: 3-methyladenine DNA glycosylase [Chloracidobacterium sp. CP2_5A]
MNRLEAALTEDFFSRDAVTVAQDLLGCILLHEDVGGIIVETEAYADDPASHATLRGPRGQLMRETHGRLYVYLIYGMHYCLNFTTDAAGPGAALIRAAAPTRGLDRMQARAARPLPASELARGPGRLCRAFGIGREHNGDRVGDRVRVLPRARRPAIACSPRIGITKGRDLLWRFYIPDEPSVSRFR